MPRGARAADRATPDPEALSHSPVPMLDTVRVCVVLAGQALGPASTTTASGDLALATTRSQASPLPTPNLRGKGCGPFLPFSPVRLVSVQRQALLRARPGATFTGPDGGLAAPRRRSPSGLGIVQHSSDCGWSVSVPSCQPRCGRPHPPGLSFSISPFFLSANDGRRLSGPGFV